MKTLKNIWMLSREYRGIAGAGGVQDVTRDLSETLAGQGYDVTCIMPCYGFISPGDSGFADTGISVDVDINYTEEERREQCRFFEKKWNGVRLVLVESERFSEKRGIYTYTRDDVASNPGATPGSGYYDYFAMNVLHQKAALAFGIHTGESPDVIHCHDGHTALTPVFIRELEGFRIFYRNTGALLTIHNAGAGYHQEVDDTAFARAVTGLPWRIIYSMMLNGMFDPLLAGSMYAITNTVSENYARELQETELDAMTGWLGHALKDRMVNIEGITNGINPDEYDPSNPAALGLPAGFHPETGDFRGKDACRRFLLDMLAGRMAGRTATDFGFPDINIHGRIEPLFSAPLFTVVSRLNIQKGMDVLAGAMEHTLAERDDFFIVILGNGDEKIEKHFEQLASDGRYKGRLAFLAGFDTRLANLVYAAGDFLMIPSRFEPCGLTDLIAQLMGNLPVARRTGGLVKVRDMVNGITFDGLSSHDIADAVNRAILLYRNDHARFIAMRKQACRIVRESYSWNKVVHRYIELYKKAADRSMAFYVSKASQ